ncbi:Spy/CpxP family protein refolding chaperone [Methylovulum psychrotolerans]|uniref:LTXXQ motif family protein n=1 Tax=Methylovulum psychrotolerans TaxID=1704499 RepID=A0A2S5CSS6_9GAMM|nr:Spy/CpxP family protein refolding chaperone [Methylovulum psychrotolerans]POZ53889.1 hypothetical protein AADEFJLK_00931 [Methylovulum psychrotolerans]
MKLSRNQFTFASIRRFAAATLIAGCFIASGSVLAAAKDDPEADHAELRINDMHAKLQITAPQEAQWAKIAQAMQEDAKNMDALSQARIDHEKDMTAVDDLKSYGEIAQAHADGIKKLIPLFATLYDGMADPQKKVADTFFREGPQTKGHKKAK